MNYIDSSTALSLIKSKAGKVHKALSEKHGFQIYLLEDNSVIGKEHDTFVEFQDVNELETFLSQYQPTRHILQDKNPFNAEFPLHTQNLINGLLDYLNIP